MTAKKQAALKKQIAEHQAALKQIEGDIQAKGGTKLTELTKQLGELRKQSTTAVRPESGYHSQIVAKPDITKWVQVDLGEPVEIARHAGRHSR